VKPLSESGAVYLVTGPMAAGKSTVARLLAERFERGVHLEGDFFRRSIVSGRQEMTPEPAPKAVAQLRLRYRLAAAAADTYAREGFTVAVEDVIAGPLLTDYVQLIRSRPLHVIVLLPAPEVLAAREGVRERAGYTRWSAEALHAVFVAETPRLGLWLDTSAQTPEETAHEILRRARESLVALSN
jgi:chloramphenicol 3-O-phosphotransferase